MPSLIVETSGVRKGGPITSRVLIGRLPTNGIVLADSSVSRLHAWIDCDLDGVYYVADTGSLTGTYVNNQQVTRRQELTDGDVIKVGKAHLIFLESSNLPGGVPAVNLAGQPPNPNVDEAGVQFECVCGAPAWFKATTVGQTHKCRQCGQSVIIPDRSGVRARPLDQVGVTSEYDPSHGLSESFTGDPAAHPTPPLVDHLPGGEHGLTDSFAGASPFVGENGLAESFHPQGAPGEAASSRLAGGRISEQRTPAAPSVAEHGLSDVHNGHDALAGTEHAPSAGVGAGDNHAENGIAEFEFEFDAPAEAEDSPPPESHLNGWHPESELESNRFDGYVPPEDPNAEAFLVPEEPPVDEPPAAAPEDRVETAEHGWEFHAEPETETTPGEAGHTETANPTDAFPGHADHSDPAVEDHAASEDEWSADMIVAVHEEGDAEQPAPDAATEPELVRPSTPLAPAPEQTLPPDMLHRGKPSLFASRRPPAEPQPTRPEPARPEPARPEPARTEPTDAEYLRDDRAAEPGISTDAAPPPHELAPTDDAATVAELSPLDAFDSYTGDDASASAVAAPARDGTETHEAHSEDHAATRRAAFMATEPGSPPPWVEHGHDEPATATRSCSVCHTSIQTEEATTTCPSCGLTFHAECWQENQGCSAYGCPQVGALAPAHEGTDSTTEATPDLATPDLTEPEPDAFPWEYLFLASSVLGTLMGLLVFGAPAAIAALGTLFYKLRYHGGEQRNGVIILSILLALVGIGLGVVASCYWWFGGFHFGGGGRVTAK